MGDKKKSNPKDKQIGNYSTENLVQNSSGQNIICDVEDAQLTTQRRQGE